METSTRPKAWRSPLFARKIDAALALRQMLNPLRRENLIGMSRRQLVVGAVWPDEHGFVARLESMRRPGIPAAWVRWRDGIEVWQFPDDPELPALAGLIDGGYEVLGHRLGRSATVRSREEPYHVIHLRPAATAEDTFRRWTSTHQALRDAGVSVAGLGPFAPELHGLRAEWIPSCRNGDPPDEPLMHALGAMLARAHAAAPPEGVEPRGIGAALDATVRQLAMATHSGSGFTQWLERRLDRWRLLGTAPKRSRAVLVHGSFQLRHISWAERPVLLGWDRAGLGDPEEDLGEMAARLYWESNGETPVLFAALRSGYASAGGVLCQELFERYASLAMVRVLALHALREPGQARLRSGQERWSAWPEVVKSF
jgi:hypothetical protein